VAYPAPVEALIKAFETLPGIGRVSAERLTFHMLRSERSGTELRDALTRVLTEAKRCSECGNVAEQETCRICADEERDQTIIAVVEEPRHVEAMERAKVFDGRYHVLMGALNPADGTEARHLSVEALLDRVAGGGIQEVILATDPDKEGEATALLVLDALESRGIPDLVISRLARGLPAGSAIEYLHKGVLEDALEDRRAIRRRR
jgi:recombination protein RecR